MKLGRKTTMRCLMVAVAALAISGFGSVMSASASGPVWLVNGAELGAGAKVAFTSQSDGTNEPKLDGLNNILCKSEQDTGELIGGNPGTDLATIEFLECAVEGKTVEECGATSSGMAAGVILTEVKTVLVYPQGEANSTTKALVAFTPDNNETTNNLFVEFTLAGTNCPIGLNNLKVDVNATGTLITAPKLEKKCGALAEIGKLNASSVFENTISGEELVTGVLNTEALLTEAELWNGAAFELITCKLEAFVAEASELAISNVTLVSKEKFGWGV
jgi:hypothetical protein